MAEVDGAPAASLEIRRGPFSWWQDAHSISNGTLEVVVPAGFGPRLMSLSSKGGKNLFRLPAAAPAPGERVKGGHRLWVAPERQEVTWIADNDPVEVTIQGNTALVRGSVEPSTGLRKSLELRFDGSDSQLAVTHRIENLNPWTIRLSLWALTQMATGGRALVRFPERGSHPRDLLPTHPLVMWAYTDLADPRWRWNYRHFLLRQDPSNARAQKAGLFHPRPLLAYLLGSDLLIKRLTSVAGAEYPDYGCSVEVFTNADMLELETLSPLLDLEPGAAAEHRETWTLYKNVSLSGESDEEIDELFRSLGVTD